MPLHLGPGARGSSLAPCLASGPWTVASLAPVGWCEGLSWHSARVTSDGGTRERQGGKVYPTGQGHHLISPPQWPEEAYVGSVRVP